MPSRAAAPSAPFLTEIDSRAAVRGSRDPLSLVPIWSAFGRRVVGNLTTASTSLRGFTTLLLGYYCADRIRERDSGQSALEVFLRVEQLVSYSRTFHNAKDTDFRGSDRVKKRLQDSTKVTICADPRHQTLGDQKTYGLWGLYSVASRTSGILLPDRPSLTPEATEFVERQYVRTMSRAGLKGASDLISAVSTPKKQIDLQREGNRLAIALASMHSPVVGAEERKFYSDFLLMGGAETNTDGRQGKVAELLGTIDTEQFAMADFRRLLRLAEKRGDEELVGRLQSILRLEVHIVAAANLFAFLLKCHGRKIADVSEDVRRSWRQGLAMIKPDITSIVERDVSLIAQAPESAGFIKQFGQHASDGDWQAAIEGLTAFNEYVMRRRGGAAWIRVEDGQIRVDYREEGVDLASAKEIDSPWRNTYFINALHGIQRELKAH
jgi:hypothetical protein